MKISFFEISKKQTVLIKALAIIAIVFHNFIHFTNGIGENEMVFDPMRVNVLLGTILSVPTMFFNAIFTYFGHYGVQLFIFISGYGLAKQRSGIKNISYAKYVVPRLIKIYSLLIFGIIVFFILFYFSIDMRSYIKFVISSLFIFKNFSWNQIFMYGYLGPWWYFSLIIQLYLIFPILYRFLDTEKERTKNFVRLLILSYLLIFIIKPITDAFNVPLYGNFIGHLPEFILGIYLAKSKHIQFTLPIIVLALVVFILSNKLEMFFPFSFLSATIVSLVICYPIYRYAKGFVLNALLFIGSISMYIFVINGPIRKPTLALFEGEGPLLILLGSVIHFLIVVIVSYIMKIVYDKYFLPYTNKMTDWVVKKI